jgi:hypothetical protein
MELFETERKCQWPWQGEGLSFIVLAPSLRGWEE